MAGSPAVGLRPPASAPAKPGPAQWVTQERKCEKGWTLPALFGGLRGENIVALCDVNEDHLGEAAKRFPAAKTYVDWRQCLDQKGLDAVVCATTDFTHAFVAKLSPKRILDTLRCTAALTI